MRKGEKEDKDEDKRIVMGGVGEECVERMIRIEGKIGRGD